MMTEQTKEYTFRGFVIPERMMEGLRLYIEEGVKPGRFLSAVLENDLSAAISTADDENLANVAAYCAYLYWEAPSSCHGSAGTVRQWIKDFHDDRAGMKGKYGNLQGAC